MTHNVALNPFLGHHGRVGYRPFGKYRSVGYYNVGDQWPVRHFEPKTTRKFSGFNRETVQIPLKEEV